MLNIAYKYQPQFFVQAKRCAFVAICCAFATFCAFAQETNPSPNPTPSSKSTTDLLDKTVVQKDEINQEFPRADVPDDPMPIAPDFAAPLRPLPDAARVGVANSNQLTLTLRDAIESALTNNNDIETTRFDVKIAEFNLDQSKGVYDPLLTSESYFESATNPTASTIGGATNGAVTQRRFFGAAGVQGFSPYYGGNYSAQFSSSRLRTSNSNATLNPQYPALFTLSYTQPLFRNRKTDNNRRQIEIAKKNLSLSDAQFRQQAIDVVAQVEQAYWELVNALRNLQVQIDAVKQAREQLESNRRQVSKGALAPIDIVAANAQITTFEQNVYSAQEAVTRAENSLKIVMLPNRTALEWSKQILPVSRLDLDVPDPQLEDSVMTALKNRPEIAQLQTLLETNQIDEDFFRNQKKPQIDFVGSYTMQGLAGTGVPRVSTTSAVTERVNELSTIAGLEPLPTGGGTVITVPDNLLGGYFSSLGNLLMQDFPTYRFGVQISLPWKNRAAEANLGRTLVQESRINNLRAQLEQTIEMQVRNSIQTLRSAKARLNAAIATRISAEQLFDSEERQFRSGTTTYYMVQQRQTDLITAKGREVQAQTELNKAVSEYYRVTGATLSVNDVSVTGEIPANSYDKTKKDSETKVD
ncbi:MAG: TolC family protein [Pyrinomonadaceae bacterium]